MSERTSLDGGNPLLAERMLWAVGEVRVEGVWAEDSGVVLTTSLPKLDIVSKT